MNKVDEMSRGKKMWEDILDAGVDTITNWGVDTIRRVIPQTMDCIVNRSQEKITTSVDSKKGNQEIQPMSMNTFLRGIECGEKRKELALIWAMGKSGFNRDQIQQVLEQAQRAYEPIE
jgi:hypothetical protein